jgi:hypothetical protein
LKGNCEPINACGTNNGNCDANAKCLLQVLAGVSVFVCPTTVATGTYAMSQTCVKTVMVVAMQMRSVRPL